MNIKYVVARSATTKRPTCQHAVDLWDDGSVTICGYDLGGTSRQFTDIRLEAILCKRCAKISEEK